MTRCCNNETLSDSQKQIFSTLEPFGQEQEAATSTGSYSGLNKDDSFACRSDDSRSLMLDVAPQELREKRRHSVISDSKRDFMQKK